MVKEKVKEKGFEGPQKICLIQTLRKTSGFQCTFKKKQTLGNNIALEYIKKAVGSYSLC